jgi:cytochrome c-type biogenesis protein CcmH
MLGWLLALLSLIPGDAAEQQARIARLENRLLAPCCYQEPLARHRSDTAAAMRAELRALVGQGKSDREILGFYQQRYGKRVLVEPEGAAWWVMGVVPLLAALLGFWFVVHMLRKWRAPSAAS